MHILLYFYFKFLYDIGVAPRRVLRDVAIK